MYDYRWISGDKVSPQQCEEMATLYSSHYGVWGPRGLNPGRNVKLSAGKLRDWLAPSDSRVAVATECGKLVGYAIAVQRPIPGRGVVSWVTQFVVEEAHRRRGVGRTLLFTIWQFSDHFAWGLVTANPYAIRALEKATRRRCLPNRIKEHQDLLAAFGADFAPYIGQARERKITSSESSINTNFPLDHSKLSEMLLNVAGPGRLWQLGPLEENWEWFAFTFHDQQQFPLSRPELEQMLSASDEVTKNAYSRMSQASGAQGWSKHTPGEVEFIREYCRVGPGDSILDFGCDRGRHTIALAETGLKTVGVDYVESAIEAARAQAKLQPGAELIVGDIRNIELGRTFDAAICLYDVVGSYVEHEQNALILENLQRHLRPGGRALISVMNFDLTKSQCKNWFSISSEPDKLLALPPSNIMESTGNIFNPSFYLLDRETKIVYRKEQFIAGDSLPCELLLRDKRFAKEEIEGLCRGAGLEVLWSRFVRAGSWRNHLARDDQRAKEILVLCEKPDLPQPVLFQ